MFGSIHRFAFSTLAVAIVLALTPHALAEEWKVDPDHTAIIFSVSHLNISNQHGRFNEIEGSLTTGEQASFEFTVQAKSVDTNNAKRDDHVRGPDFLNVKQFPVITFAGNSAAKTESGYALAGDLTLHGVTRHVNIELTKVGEGDDPWGNYRIGFETTFTIKRSDFGMNNMLDMVGDKVTLTVSFEAIRQ